MKRALFVAVLVAAVLTTGCHKKDRDHSHPAPAVTGSYQVQLRGTEAGLYNCTPRTQATHEATDYTFSGTRNYPIATLDIDGDGETTTVKGDGFLLEYSESTGEVEARIYVDAIGGELVCGGTFTSPLFDLYCPRIQFKTGGGGPVTETCELNPQVLVTVGVY